MKQSSFSLYKILRDLQGKFDFLCAVCYTKANRKMDRTGTIYMGLASNLKKRKRGWTYEKNIYFDGGIISFRRYRRSGGRG